MSPGLCVSDTCASSATATAANGSGSSELKNSAADKRLKLFSVLQLELEDKNFTRLREQTTEWPLKFKTVR